MNIYYLGTQVQETNFWTILLAVLFSSGILAAFISIFGNCLREESNNKTLAIKSLRLLLITIYEQEDFSQRLKKYLENKVQKQSLDYTFFGESIHKLGACNDLISNINLNSGWCIRIICSLNVIKYFRSFIQIQRSIPDAYFISIRILNIANSEFLKLKKQLKFLNRKIESKQQLLNSLPGLCQRF